MSQIDWIILCGVLGFIVLYGAWKTRKNENLDGFLLGDRSAKWWLVGLSVMATQASAITFLSTPGQAFSDGMRFVQFYFGLPLAMVVLCITFIPIYYKLKVYTAYEFLESRFDVRTRSLTSLLFLIQRGLAAGITIYAPAIILSSILNWNLTITNLVIGCLVIIYTVSGGTKAVSITQKYQMMVIFGGMVFTFMYLINSLPENVSFTDALHVSGLSGKMNVIDLSFDLNNRYTLWSGIIGGFFLALSYFGTDQSQVQRYLSARSIRESRMGLLFNAALKVPMQFFILLVGVMVFVFYQFNPAPVFFNDNTLNIVEESRLSPEMELKYQEYDELFRERNAQISEYLLVREEGSTQEVKEKALRIATLSRQEDRLREDVRGLITQVDPDIETNDRDYVFLHFILTQLPTGLIGLLLAVILSAAMSSTAAELNALASTTTVDLYKRLFAREGSSDRHYVFMSRMFTLSWGVIAILFAVFGNLYENLIQYVNIVGSLFYGTILGIFLVAFYVKKIGGKAVFLAAIISECIVFAIFAFTEVGYLWFNLIGCINVILLGYIIEKIILSNRK
ncbi:MAG: sodium:solute symporter [Saprospiraceae bacterium]|nr:sodium:solute symporter [Saprospiraceae bacterium]